MYLVGPILARLFAGQSGSRTAYLWTREMGPIANGQGDT